MKRRTHRFGFACLIVTFVSLLAAVAYAHSDPKGSPVISTTDSIVYLPFVTSPSSHSVFYVSIGGDNSTGRSWQNAWNEFDQIKWDLISPGDHIYVDGGESSMRYLTAIHPTVSGAAEKPILIQLSDEQGRDGQAVIFGGNEVPLPECGQVSWDESHHESAGIAGLHFENNISHITVDGRKRSGFVVHGWKQHGVKFYPDRIDNDADDNPSNISLSYIEIYNNGEIERKNDGTSLDLYYPLHSGSGIKLAGVAHQFRFLEIHDNAADAIQSAFTGPTSGVFNNMDNLTLSDSWLYNQRPHSGIDNSPSDQVCTPNDRSGCDELGAPHMADDYQDYPEFPTNRRESFNWCTHSDGIQIYSSDEFNTMRIDRTIIGPNFMNALILGDRNNANETAWINNLALRDVVLTRYMHNALGMKNRPDRAGRNWVLSNVTMYGHYSNTNKDTLSLDSNQSDADHRILNSIMVYGRTAFPNDNVSFSNNCEYALYSGSIEGTEIDPQFKTLSEGDIFEEDLNVDFATVFKDDYTIGAPLCQAFGSRIHSVEELLNNFGQR